MDGSVSTCRDRTLPILPSIDLTGVCLTRQIRSLLGPGAAENEHPTFLYYSTDANNTTNARLEQLFTAIRSRCTSSRNSEVSGDSSLGLLSSDYLFARVQYSLLHHTPIVASRPFGPRCRCFHGTTPGSVRPASASHPGFRREQTTRRAEKKTKYYQEIFKFWPKAATHRPNRPTH